MNKKTTIYIFGNPLLSFDSLPIKLKPELEKLFSNINFQIADPNENIKPINKELIIIDTALNINEVRILTDIDKIELEQKYSAHDFDLGLNLKILKKIGQLKKTTIFCVPSNITKKEALDQLEPLIKKYT